MSKQQIDLNNSNLPSGDKFAAWNKFQEDHKHVYPNEDEKVRRSKLSIDYQLTKFYDRFVREDIVHLMLDTKWRHYVDQYYYHMSLTTTFSQERLLLIAKAYFNSQGLKFTPKFKQADLPAEFATFFQK